jgi:hypothetical protein
VLRFNTTRSEDSLVSTRFLHPTKSRISEGTFLFLPKNKAICPVSLKNFIFLSDFLLNQFIIKAHYLSKTLLHCQRGPDDTQPQKERMEKWNMTEKSTKDEENKNPGSVGSGKPGIDGVTGPSHEVSQRDQGVSGAENAVQEENSELEWGKQHMKDEPAAVKQEPVPQPVRSVFRKTELHGVTPGSTPHAGKKTRRRTMQRLESPGAMVSYHPLEVAFKDFICSLMERQDMVREELLMQSADLQQQIDALEERRNKIKKTESCSDSEV